MFKKGVTKGKWFNVFLVTNLPNKFVSRKELPKENGSKFFWLQIFETFVFPTVFVLFEPKQHTLLLTPFFGHTLPCFENTIKTKVWWGIAVTSAGSRLGGRPSGRLGWPGHPGGRPCGRRGGEAARRTVKQLGSRAARRPGETGCSQICVACRILAYVLGTLSACVMCIV